MKIFMNELTMKFHFRLLYYLTPLLIFDYSIYAQTETHPSRPAYTISEKDAHLECITYDPKGHNFFLGSVHKRKIIKIDSKGNVSDFVAEMQDSLYAVIGLQVDGRRNVLWVCCSALPEMKGYSANDKGKVAVLKLDLQTGRLLKKYMPYDNERHILGEPIVAGNGDVYISDSGVPNIYRIGKGDTLELLLRAKAKSLQGIAFSKNDNILFYSDYSSGLYKCNVKTKDISKLLMPDTFEIKGADGLYYYNNSLVAIQNGVTPAMICQYTLNKEQTRIISRKILEKGHPAFNEPTLGTIVKDTLYYIANSQWSGYDDNHQILPLDRLQEIKVLKLPLSRP